VLPSNVRIIQDDAGVLRVSTSSPAMCMIGLLLLTVAISFVAALGIDPLMQRPWWVIPLIAVCLLGLIFFVGGRILEVSRTTETIRYGWGWRSCAWTFRTGTLRQVKGMELGSFVSLVRRPIEPGADLSKTVPDMYQLSLRWGEEQVKLFDSPNLDALVTLASKIARFAGWSMLEIVPESVLVEGAVSPQSLLREGSTAGWVPMRMPQERTFVCTQESDGMKIEIEPFRPVWIWITRLILIVLGIGPTVYWLINFSGEIDWIILLLFQSFCWIQAIPLLREQNRFGRFLVVRRDQLQVTDLLTLWGLRTRVIPAAEIVAIKIGHPNRQLDPIGLRDNQQELIIDDGREVLTIGPGFPWLKLAWLRRQILATFFPAPET